MLLNGQVLDGHLAAHIRNAVQIIIRLGGNAGVGEDDTVGTVHGVFHVGAAFGAVEMPHCRKHTGQVTACGGAGDEYAVRVYAVFLGVLADVNDRRGYFLKKSGKARLVPDGIMKDESVKAAGHKFERDRLALVFAEMGVCSAGENYDSGVVPGTGVGRERDLRLVFKKTDDFGFHGGILSVCALRAVCKIKLSSAGKITFGKRKVPDGSRTRFILTYARSILPERRQREQTLTVLCVPLTTAFTFLMFGFHARFVLRCE